LLLEIQLNDLVHEKPHNFGNFERSIILQNQMQTFTSLVNYQEEIKTVKSFEDLFKNNNII